MKNEICLMVTGDCNLACPHCSQGEWRKGHRQYHMTPDEILALQRVTGYKCETVHIAGGEPTMWKHWWDGLRMVRRSGLGRRIVVSSNCFDYTKLLDALDSCARVIDQVYCQESNASPAGIGAIQKAFPNRIVVGRRKVHKPLPTKPLDYTLPAKCGCDRPAYFDGFVYQCADVYPHSVRMGYSMDTPSARWPLMGGVNWAVVMGGNGRHRHPACRVCLANKNVWRQIP